MNQTKKTVADQNKTALLKVEEGQIEFSNFDKLGAIKNKISAAQIDYLHKTLYSTLDSNNVLLVLYKAHSLKLDVLNGELTAYKNSKGQLIMIVGKDAKNRLAQNTGLIKNLDVAAIYTKKVKDGEEEVTVACQPWEGTLWGAYATLRRTDMDSTEFKVTVPLSEYRSENALWKTKPDTMIKKVALSQVLTLGFPELFAGVYYDSEIDQNGRKQTDLPVSEKDGEKANDAQLQMLKSLKIEHSEDISFGEAARLINESVQGGKS